MNPDVAVLGPLRRDVLEPLEREFTLHQANSPETLARVAAAHGPRIRGAVSNGMFGLSTAALQALPALEICSILGVGLETTDLPLARARGVVVTTTPVLTDDVADLAVLLSMAACRRLAEADRFVRAGGWKTGRLGSGRSFSRRRAGIVGLGRIGAAVAQRLRGFGMPIGYHDPLPKDGAGLTPHPSVLALAEASDLLVLCAAGGADRSPILGAEAIAALGPDGVLVNVARGWLVDEPALIAALAGGRLGAAGLDVFVEEPEVPAALLALDNVVLSPHIASNTVETQAAMRALVQDNLRAWFGGRGALTPVT